MMSAIRETNFRFPHQEAFYRGKVRDVYIFRDKLVMIASDRISAFDVILPEPIPYKGQVLNQLSAFFLKATADLVPNWLTANPDPNAAVGLRCTPLPIEMVIRGYLAGTAWRAYKAGQRVFNGYALPEGLRENDRLPMPIVTPSTKAEQGQHDEEISTKEILDTKLVGKEVYEQVEAYTKVLFQKGTEIAESRGLILADTKYEFGVLEGKVYLIDEIHTPDSARYFDLNGYAEKQNLGQPQPQRSKEMVRQWLIQHGFQGREGERIPQMTNEWVASISLEYIKLYEQLTAQSFVKPSPTNRLDAMEQAVLQSL
jgi:phosphoribosylaminoimidazole-succinocarboxamide synthase